LTKVILVRHGETDWNKLKYFQGGGSNTQLNENGEQQAKSLALRLKPESIQAIYSSPLQRALDTAQAIAGYHQLKVGIKPDLNELDCGELEGIPISNIGKSLGELLITGSQGEILPRLPGGESLVELRQRAWKAIQGLVSKHPDEVIVVASHFFTILSIICSVLNLPLSEIGRLRLVPASISTIVFDKATTRLVLFNDTCHLTSLQA